MSFDFFSALKTIDSDPYQGKPFIGPGSGLQIKTGWKDSFSKEIEQKGIKHLFLNYVHGWSCQDYSFLENIPAMTTINIIDVHSRGLESIKHQVNVRSMSLNLHIKASIDFQSFKNLEKLFVSYSKYTDTFFECASINDLYVDEMRIGDKHRLSHLTNLQTLTIANASITNLDFLHRLKSLRSLELLNCKHIEHFNPISSCSKLKWLRIDGSKNIENLDFLSGLLELETLLLSLKNIQTIKPIQYLSRLKALSIIGNSAHVEDGDFSFMEGLSDLRMFYIPMKKHYSHRPARPWNWELINSTLPAVLKNL
jgi:hypothetical protein